MIQSVFIFSIDGLSLFHMTVDSKEYREINDLLFAGVSSAIKNLMDELGHKDLQSIDVSDGMLIYSSSHNVIFVIHARDKEGAAIGKFLVKQIEYEFIKTYEKIITSENFNIQSRTTYEPFKSKIMSLYKDLSLLYEKQPRLFNFFPNTIPISLVKEILIEGEDLISGYPNTTIKLARILEEKYIDSTNKTAILFSLGKFIGYEIAKQRFSNKIALNVEDVLKILNEISIAKFDKKKEHFKLEICPICRGKKTEDMSCDFFSGFIEGVLDNPHLSIKETSCKATGDKYCTFQIKKIS